MSDDTSRSQQLQADLDRIRQGDSQARDQLLNTAMERFHEIASRMLGRFTRIRRWEQSDDIAQNVMIRMMRAVDQVMPATVRDFLKLATLNTRRELLDLVKHYYGPNGLGMRHDSQGPPLSGKNEQNEPAAGDTSYDPSLLAMWTEFHEQVELLPDEEREVFELHWYQGLPQEEVVQIMGMSLRTVKRRWQSARLKLFDALKGRLPDTGVSSDDS